MLTLLVWLSVLKNYLFSSTIHHDDDNQDCAELDGEIESDKIVNARLGCLEDIEHMSNLEDNLKSMCTSIGNMASYVKSTAEDSPRTASTATDAQRCVLGMHRKWTWIQKLLECENIHIEDASRYHQHYHLIKEYTTWLRAEVGRIGRHLRSTAGNIDQLERVLGKVFDSLQMWTTRLLELRENKRHIAPVHLRVQLVDHRAPVIVTALCDYTTHHDQVCVDKGDELVLLDNSVSHTWKVSKDDSVIFVPSIILRIPPLQTLTSDDSLERELKELCMQYSSNIREKLAQLLSSYVLSITLKLNSLNANEKQLVLNSVKELQMESLDLVKSTALSSSFETLLVRVERSLKDNSEPSDVGLGVEVDEGHKSLLLLSKIEHLFSQYKGIYGSFETGSNTTGDDVNMNISNDDPESYHAVQFLQGQGHNSNSITDSEAIDFRLLGVTASKSVSMDDSSNTISLGASSSNIGSIEESFSNMNSMDKSSSIQDYADGSSSSTVSMDILSNTTSMATLPSKVVSVEASSFYTDSMESVQSNNDSIKTCSSSNIDSVDASLSNIESMESNTNSMVGQFEVIANGTSHNQILTTEIVASSEAGVDIPPLGGAPIHLEDASNTTDNSMSVSVEYMENVHRLDLNLDGQAGSVFKNQDTRERRECDNSVAQVANSQARDELEEYSAGELFEERGVKETKRLRAETTQMTNTEQEESLTYIITGVVHPQSGEVISLDEATRLAIINRSNGTYVDCVTGEITPIQVAMSQGNIKIEYTRSKKSAEKRSDVYTITIRTQRESRPYTIKGVIDTKTEKRLTLPEAVKSGILDKLHTAYRNPNTGEELTMDDALDSGLLCVVFDDVNVTSDPVTETKTYVIHSVVDVKN